MDFRCFLNICFGLLMLFLSILLQATYCSPGLMGTLRFAPPWIPAYAGMTYLLDSVVADTGDQHFNDAVKQ